MNKTTSTVVAPQTAATVSNKENALLVVLNNIDEVEKAVNAFPKFIEMIKNLPCHNGMSVKEKAETFKIVLNDFQLFEGALCQLLDTVSFNVATLEENA